MHSSKTMAHILKKFSCSFVIKVGGEEATIINHIFNARLKTVKENYQRLGRRGNQKDTKRRGQNDFKSILCLFFDFIVFFCE